MRAPSISFFYLLLAAWAAVFSGLLLGAYSTTEIEFVPIVGTLWRAAFYVMAFALPVFLLPLALYCVWKLGQRSWRAKLLHTIPWVAMLFPWGMIVFITLFVLSFGDGLTNSVFSIQCAGSNEKFYLRDANAWIDDGPGSANRIFTLYHRRFLALKPLASTGVHTRGDVGYKKIDTASASTSIELLPIQSAMAQVRYFYLPALRELRCEFGE